MALETKTAAAPRSQVSFANIINAGVETKRVAGGGSKWGLLKAEISKGLPTFQDELSRLVTVGTSVAAEVGACETKDHPRGRSTTRNGFGCLQAALTTARHAITTPRHATRAHHPHKSKTRCTYTASAPDLFILGPVTHPFAILLLHILPLSSPSPSPFSFSHVSLSPLPALKVAVLEDLADRIESGKVAVDGMDWNEVFLGALER
jgi:hypothetical protein